MRTKKRVMRRFLLLLFFCAACGLALYFGFRLSGARVENTRVGETISRALVPSTQNETWKQVVPDIERLDYVTTSNTEMTLTLYRFAPGQFDWRFAYASSSQNVSGWLASEPNASVAANAFYFHEDQTPSGFLVTSGTRVGSREFDWKKTGLLELAPTLRILDTKYEEVDQATLKEAGQSYPFLVKDGQNVVTEDSGKRARRTFIGFDERDRLYLGIVSFAPVSLWELGDLLAHMPIHWRYVLNLDGGPSSGLAVRASDRSEIIDSYVPVPIVILGERKK
jgi:hypothetical protein